MTKDTDLLPCPFCGSDDLWIAASCEVNRLETRPDRKAVQCQGCSAFAPIRLWNTRSRPSGLALEWRQVGTRDEYLQHNIYIGAFVFGAVIELTGGCDAQAWEAGVTKYVARRVPLLDAKAALEAHVRSALGVEDGPASPNWHTFDQKPESSKRIIALYSDGSGANLYFVHDAGLIDAHGDDCDRFSDVAGLWAYLPDGFELWCEAFDGFLPLPNTEGNDD